LSRALCIRSDSDGERSRLSFPTASKIKQCLSRLQSYVFTDISLSFIVGTKQELSKAYPAVKLQRYLDTNKPCGEQKFSAESFDLIYGVNAAHVARDSLGFRRGFYTHYVSEAKSSFPSAWAPFPQTWHRREFRRGRSTIIAVDEAQNLDTTVLETIRLLSNF
jgi:hypothetical protein